VIAIGILDFIVLAILVTFLVWIIPNIIRYLHHKTVGDEGISDGWWALSERWIHNDELKKKRKEEVKNKKS
jgi:competence protein ComGC